MSGIKKYGKKSLKKLELQLSDYLTGIFSGYIGLAGLFDKGGILECEAYIRSGCV